MAQQSHLPTLRIETNQTRILRNSHESRDRHGLKNKTVFASRRGRVGSQNPEMNKMNETKLLTKVLFALFFVLVPIVAVASIRSFVTSMFKGDAEASVFVQNSQNMALLQAAIAPQNQPIGGGDIAIVDSSSLLAENSGVSASKEASSDQITTYVVRQGDTLSTIAKMFNVTTNTIVWSNDITGNKVSPGDRLVILPVSGVRHTVKKGDTLSTIAKSYKGDLEEIAQFNDLSVDAKLALGDTVIIPDGEMLGSHTTTVKTVSPASTKTLQKYLSAPKYDGYYIRPLIGGIKTQGVHGNNGVDIAASFGTAIIASASGEVIVAKGSGWNGGYGSYVVIRHSNGTQTLYAHLSGVQVSVGETVYQGQIIGNMGSTGKSTGTHLHFEVRGARNPF